MLRLLIISVPGGPGADLADAISDFHGLPLAVVDDLGLDGGDPVPAKEPAIEELSMAAEVSETKRAEEIEGERLLARPAPFGGPFPVLSAEEIGPVLAMAQGVIFAGIPDLRFADWATHTVFLNMSDDKAAEWFSKRRGCPTCGEAFHDEDKPARERGVCDRCGTDLVQAPEDGFWAVRRAYMDWRTAFWPIRKRSETRGIWRTYSLDKFETFESLVSAVVRKVKGEIRRERPMLPWTYEMAGGGAGPEETP